MNLDEVGIKLVKERSLNTNGKPLTKERAINLIANEIKLMDREMCMILNLDRKRKPINAHFVAMGGINEAKIYYHNIIKSAVLSEAYGIVLFHNHPSGCWTPSKEDVELTKDIDKICKSMDIRLMDHIIATKNEYYSMKDDLLYAYTDELHSINYKRFLCGYISKKDHKYRCVYKDKDDFNRLFYKDSKGNFYMYQGKFYDILKTVAKNADFEEEIEGDSLFIEELLNTLEELDMDEEIQMLNYDSLVL